MVTQLKQYKSGKFYKDEFRGDMSWNGNEYNNLLRNEGLDEHGNLKFADVAMALGADDITESRGMAVADFDNDGDLDIVIATNPGDVGDDVVVSPVLLRNDIGSQRNWFVLDLQGVDGNRDAIGAEVHIELQKNAEQPVRLMRHVTCGSGYASQNDHRIFFGLGEYEIIKSIRIRWPGGNEQAMTGVKANQSFRLIEGGDLQPVNPNLQINHQAQQDSK